MKCRLLLAILVLIGCGESKPVSNYPYQYIEIKKEESSQMLLFAYDGPFNTDSLKQFCKERKQSFQSGIFYIIVIFDKKENASFPRNPITAMYGMDKDVLVHIRAMYAYNKLNGYSKLTVYEKNAYESAPMVSDIP